MVKPTLQSISSAARNLGNLRGLSNMNLEDNELSPRVRQIRHEDLLPPTDPVEEEGRGKSVYCEISLARTKTKYQAGRTWYICFGSKLLFPFVTLLTSLGFSSGLALYIWEYRKPLVREGAFGKLAQNIRPESVQEANFAKARVRAVSGPTLLGLDVGGNGTIVGAAEGFEWRRVELIYQVRTGSVVAAGVLGAAKKFENELKDLPGWKILCNHRVPKAQQRFCDPGDSFPAVMFATGEGVAKEISAQGVLLESKFNGRGQNAFLPLNVILEFLENFHPEVFKRWYKIDVERTPVVKAQVMRTLFSFYLPTSSASGEWMDFVNSELLDTLKAGAQRGLGSATLFYRADGVALEEFSYAVIDAIFWAIVAASGALISTVIVTRRVLLGCAAMMLAGISSAVSAASVSKFHEDGFVEFPVVAIASWFLNAVNSADLAIACVSAWEVADPLPRTTFAEIARFISTRLAHLEMPERSHKLKWSLCVLLKGFLGVVDKFFPPRDADSDETPLTECFPIGRMYWFLTNLLLPPVVTGIGLLLIASKTELLLLQEFSMHAGPGLLSSAFFAVLLYPPVIDLGDVLNQTTHQCRFMKRFKTCLHQHCVPLECGADPEWRHHLRGTIEVFALMLNRWPMRFIAFVVTVAVIIGFSYSNITSAFVATPPPLFPAGHRSREGPKVRQIFGQMPRHLEAPENTLESARKCSPDAFGNASCSWYRCEVEQRSKAEDNKCTCKRRWGATTTTPTTTTLPVTTTTSPSLTTVPHFSTTLPASIAPTGSCSAVARIAGKVSHQDFPQARFWKWAEGVLGITLGDGSGQVLEPQQIGSIEMEDWATGDFKVSKQFSIGLKIANKDMPKMEDACVALLCYCGISPCDLDSAGWETLGQVELNSTTTAAPSVGGRRLVSEVPAAMERRLVHANNARPFLGHRRLIGESSKVDPEDINIIWGLQKTDEIPFRNTNSDLKFDKQFRMEDPWTQRSVASFCEGIAPDLNIVSTHCWALDFKRWLAGQGETYPVRADAFYNMFFQFTVNRHANHKAASNAAGGGASGGHGYDYFWLSESSRIRGTFVNFKVNAPKSNQRALVQDYMKSWSTYLSGRNGLSKTPSGVAWMASPLFAQSQTAEIVRTSCYLTVGTLMAVACAVTLVLTCSIGITVAILTSLVLCMCAFGTFWTGFGKRDIGSMEIVSLSVFLSGLTTPLVRVSNAYAYARDRPHLPVDIMLQETEVAEGRRSTMKFKSPEEIEEIAKQRAEDMGEGEILMFPGAINNERQNRVATAMQRGGAPALGLGGAAVIGGLALLPLEMEALGQVGLSILCMGFAVPMAVGLLSLLLLLGLGDSKARRRAFRELGRYTCSRLSGKVHFEGTGLLDGRSKQEKGAFSKPRNSVMGDLDAGTANGRMEPQLQPQLTPYKPHTVAAMMLGAPMSIATGNVPKMMRKSKKLQEDPRDDQLKQAADDVGSEAGPCIWMLDVQGATAKPPYHIVMATRNVINVKG